jgi:hypothetical protein
MISVVVVDLAVAELDALHERLAGSFPPSEPRAQLRQYMAGLECRSPTTPGSSMVAVHSAEAGLWPAEEGQLLDRVAARSRGWRLGTGSPGSYAGCSRSAA